MKTKGTLCLCTLPERQQKHPEGELHWPHKAERNVQFFLTSQYRFLWACISNYLMTIEYHFFKLRYIWQQFSLKQLVDANETFLQRCWFHSDLYKMKPMQRMLGILGLASWKYFPLFLWAVGLSKTACSILSVIKVFFKSYLMFTICYAHQQDFKVLFFDQCNTTKLHQM